LDRNFLIALVLSLLVITGWQMWEAERRPAVEFAEEGSELADGGEATGLAAVEERARVEAVEQSGRGTESQLNARELEDTRDGAVAREGAGASRPEAEPWEGVFEGEFARAVLSNRGGSLASWKLLDERYSITDVEDAEVPIELITAATQDGVALTTPFEELGFGDLSNARFEVERKASDEVVFALERDGVRLRKHFRFPRDGYELRLSLEIENHGDRVIVSPFNVDWPAAVVEGNDFKEQSFSALVNDEVEKEAVAGVGSGGFFGKFFGGGGGEEGPEVRRGEVAWMGVDTKYFITALLPDDSSNANVVFTPIVENVSGNARLSLERVEIHPGETARREFRAYLGPKETERLLSAGARLEKSVYLGYSWVSPLTRFFSWLLGVFYSVIPNYGWAIIVMTILVRLVTFPIMSHQMRSMERMRALQPKLKAIQESHKEDKQRQSEETMKLYKDEGVNPLGGCFPMLLQFPVFIGLFFALQSTIELRHAPFILWINDLSAPEYLFEIPGLGFPFRVLPLIMGASMVVQQKMTPMTTVDPAQAKMMTTVMPIMMTVLFYQFPSGLVLYWMVSNFLGIGHQLWVGRKMRAEGKA
jgi:YidC/Oxa1 family membrane protein insertase